MPQIVYLDENGNPQKDAPIYLDANGNPGPAGHSSDYMARQNALIEAVRVQHEEQKRAHGGRPRLWGSDLVRAKGFPAHAPAPCRPMAGAPPSQSAPMVG